MADILQAARSYYGLADIESCTTQLFTNQAGQACVAFEIPLSPEDFIAIGERMKAMQQEESQQVERAPIFGEDIDTHAIRQQYNALSKAERGKYGSFGKYMSAISNGIIDDAIAGHIDSVTQTVAANSKEGRQVVHVDAPEEPEPVSMDAVWLKTADTTDAQRMHSSDCRISPECAGDFDYLIQWAMLTDEQKKKAKEGGK